MPRYVVLRHEVPESFPRPSHWDLMLEAEEVLLAWSLPQTPEPGHWMSAESLARHRKMYLDFEGEISASRGCVQRWDWGDFDWLERNDDRLVVCLRGQRLRGTLTLQRTGTGQTWQLTFASDEAASSGGGTVSGTETTEPEDQRG